ncbi:MAG: response regulator, partial [Massilia sp.]
MIEDNSTVCSVLLIDDESFAQDIIAHGLKSCVGHQLRYESSPSRAVEVARDVAATVVIVDLRMPGGLDGFDVIAMLRAHPDTHDVPVILLSSED